MDNRSSVHAYPTTPSPQGDPRHIEGWALIQAANRLAATQRDPVDEAALLEAVRTNWRLWTIFQASLVAPDCPLPREIRQNLLSLSNFIDRQSAGLIADPDPGRLDVLIRINRELAGGLLTSAPTAEANSATADPAHPTPTPINVRL